MQRNRLFFDTQHPHCAPAVRGIKSALASAEAVAMAPLLLGFLGCWFLPGANVACLSHVLAQSTEAIVAEAFQPFVTRGVLSGSLLVKRGDRELRWEFGLANDGTGARNGKETLFLIASLSKSFVAASVLELAERGALHLEDPLFEYLPEYPREHLIGANGEEVTIENLLTHSSGVPDAYSAPEIEEKIDGAPISFPEMLAAIDDRPLRFDPGTRFEYSNTGYVLLGEVVRRVVRSSSATFLSQAFFHPLGLDDTSVGLPSDGLARVARPYHLEKGRRVDLLKEEGVAALANSEVFADTDIYTNVENLGAWVEAVTTGRVLNPQWTEAMLTPHLEGYGYGWDIYTDREGRRVYEHAGDYADYQSWMRRYPAEHLEIIWLGNQRMRDDDLDSLIEKVSAAALAAPW